mmetsp:Transcript_116439/g.276748  ORF Transcript_116439/g.276748 Transcript_116439/m.276748 type:complete len:97 (+) Transcript_116439:3-293(+)
MQSMQPMQPMQSMQPMQPMQPMQSVQPGPNLMELKQAEVQLEQQEAGIHQQVLRLRQLEREAQAWQPSTPQVPQAAPMMGGWQWVAGYPPYMQGLR